jgi:hypothetical protein
LAAALVALVGFLAGGLWVPVIRPCWSGGLLIFMDDSGDAVVSAGAEGIEVGDRRGQRGKRSGTRESAVRPVFVVVLLVRSKDTSEVRKVPDQSPVEQFPATGSDPPFHDGVHTRHADARSNDAYACGGEHGIEAVVEERVAVVQYELDIRSGVLEVHQQVAGLLDDPAPAGMVGGAQDADAPSGVFDRCDGGSRRRAG